MRRPPDNSKSFQKRLSMEGPYFVILDPQGQELATSRVFRNDAWYTVGCELLRDVMDSEQRDAEENMGEGTRPRGFSGILTKRTEEGRYQFVYITSSGRTLLTSAKFSSQIQAKSAVTVFRRTVHDIVCRTKWDEYMPS